MKTVLCLVLMMIGVYAINAAYLEGHDGRPDCKTEDELKKVNWRNNNDPTFYWVCSKLNVPATSEKCKEQTAFMTPLRGCVEWNKWEWEQPVNPPSMHM